EPGHPRGRPRPLEGESARVRRRRERARHPAGLALRRSGFLRQRKHRDLPRSPIHVPAQGALLAGRHLLLRSPLVAVREGGPARRFFDLLTVTTEAGKLTQPIVLVAINEESFEAMKRQWPWPRGLHAQLIDRLTKGGAIAIGVDLFLPDPSTPAEDAALATAI